MRDSPPAHRPHAPGSAADVASRVDPVRAADRLHSAAIHLLRRLRRQDDASGLTAPRLSALSVVVFGGPLTIGALAAAEHVRPPTMTRTVAALEAAGLVVREPSPDDGRAALVRATAAGSDLLRAGRSRRVDALAAQFAALPPDEVETLARAAQIMERLARGPE
jgi:DNA-binding MarR family transcriptional regulator